jgi:hypothetical protein
MTVRQMANLFMDQEPKSCRAGMDLTVYKMDSSEKELVIQMETRENALELS